MKKIILFLVIFSLSVLQMFGQTLYVSTQNNSTSSPYSGEGDVTAPKNESWTCSLSKDSDIITYSISPLAGGEGKTTVTGSVSAVPENAPAAGTSQIATITGDCNWNWKEWKKDLNLKNAEGNYKDRVTPYSFPLTVTVVSIKVTISGEVCTCGSWQLSAETTPKGQDVKWSNGETASSISIPYSDALSGTKISATLNMDGATYTAETTLEGLATTIGHGSVPAGGENFTITIYPNPKPPMPECTWTTWGCDATGNGGTSNNNSSHTTARPDQRYTYVKFDNLCGTILIKKILVPHVTNNQ